MQPFLFFDPLRSKEAIPSLRYQKEGIYGKAGEETGLGDRPQESGYG